MLNKLIAGLLVYMLAVTQVIAQTATLVPNAKQTFLGTTGAPLAAGTVTMYVPNSTNKKTTWLDAYQASTNTNPVVLDAAGRGVIFGQGNYRQVVKDKNGVQIWDSFTSAVGSSVPSGATGTDTAPVGSMMPFSGFTVPVNWQIAIGQLFTRADYSELLTALTIVNISVTCTLSSNVLSGFSATSDIVVGADIEATCIPPGTKVSAVSGTNVTVTNNAATSSVVTTTVFNWGNGNGTTTFRGPNMLGRVAVGKDCNLGSCQGVLTSTYYGSEPKAAGVYGGSQSKIITQANLPVVTLNTTIASGQGSHNHTLPSETLFAISGNTYNATGAAIINIVPATTTNNSVLPAMTGTTPLGGNATPISSVTAAATVNYIIKVKSNTTGAGGVVSLGGMFGDIVCDSSFTCAPIGSSPAVNTIGCTPASTTQLGCVIPDGITTIISGGKLTAVTGSLIIGSTPITGGISTRVLMNNSGTLNEYSISGTGSVCMTINCTLVSPTITTSFIATGLVTNSDLSNVAAWTLKGNATGSSSAPQDFTIAGLSHKVSPTTSDLLLINDVSASNAFKYSTIAEVIGSIGTGVISIAGNTGAFTLGQGLANSTNVLTVSTGVATNTLLAKVANYTMANTDCGKTIQAGTGSTGFFTLTLPSISGFASDCIINIKNGDTVRAKGLSGFPAGLTSPSMLWPLQGLQVAIINGAWAITTNPGRWKVPNNTTVYMDVINGSDSNDCLASGVGNACATFDKAVRTNIKDYYDLSGSSSFPTATIVVQLADNASSGTCTSTCYALAHIAFTAVGGEGRNAILIQGNPGSPGNVVISDATGANIGNYGGTGIEVRNLQLGQTSCGASPKANGGFEASDSSSIRLEGGIILGCATNAQLSASNQGKIFSDGTISITAGANYLISADSGGSVNLNSQTVTFSNSPTYGQQTISALALSNVQVSSTTWTNGGTVTATKFFCRDNAVIRTDAGTSVIPGGGAGTSGTGCQVN